MNFIWKKVHPFTLHKIITKKQFPIKVLEVLKSDGDFCRKTDISIKKTLRYYSLEIRHKVYSFAYKPILYKIKDDTIAVSSCADNVDDGLYYFSNKRESRILVIDLKEVRVIRNYYLPLSIDKIAYCNDRFYLEGNAGSFLRRKKIFIKITDKFSKE